MPPALPAITSVAQTVARVGATYAPAIVSKANSMLKSVTSGRVTDIAAIPQYVQNSPERLAVVARAAVSSGMNPDALFPQDLIGNDATLRQIRGSLQALIVDSRNAYDAGTQARLKEGTDDTARDLLKKQSVRAVRAVYGNENRYFLCHPNGGVPRAWFTWYDAVVKDGN